MVEQEWTSGYCLLGEEMSPTESVAFSPTEDLIVRTSMFGTTGLWDYITGTERFRFDEPERHYCCGTFSPDGKSVALGSVKGLISIKEFGKGSAIDFKGHSGRVSHVVFSPKSGKILASASHNGIRIWNVDERQTTQICDLPTDGVLVAQFTPNGQFLDVGGYSGSLTMWNVDSGKCVRTFDAVDTSSVEELAISMDGEKAVFIQRRQTHRWACLFNLSTGRRQFESSCESDGVLISLLPPDEKFVLIGLAFGNIEIRDVESWSIVRQIHTSNFAKCFALSRDGELLASCGFTYMDQLKIWDMRSSAMDKKISEIRHDPDNFVRFSSDDIVRISNRFQGPEAHIWNVADDRMESLPIGDARSVDFSPDGRYVLLKDKEGLLQLWCESMTTQLLHSKRFRNIVFSPDGNLMALISIDGRAVQIVDSTTFGEIMTWEALDIAHITFSPNGQVVELYNSDPETGTGTLELWNLPHKTRLWRTTMDNFDSDTDSVRIEFSPNGQMAALLLLDLETEERAWKILELASGKENWVYGVGQLVFHPESHLVAIETQLRGSDDIHITIIETDSLESKHSLELHGPAEEKCRISSMAISSTGKLVAASSRRYSLGYQTIQLWNTATGIEIGRYEFEEIVGIRRLSFFDDHYLLCDQGRLPVPFALPRQAETDAQENRGDARDCLFLGSQWVYQGLERILWLPPAYRSGASFMRGETLVLQHGTGVIRILKFDTTEAPASTVRPEVPVLY